MSSYLAYVGEQVRPAVIIPLLMQKHMLRSSCFVELLIQLGKFTASTYHVLFAADGDVSSLCFSFHSLHAGMFMMAATQLSGLNRLKRGLQAAVSTA